MSALWFCVSFVLFLLCVHLYQARFEGYRKYGNAPIGDKLIELENRINKLENKEIK